MGVQDRHWDQLVQATRVKFTMSDETTLADLLSLNLHNFEEEVNTRDTESTLHNILYTVYPSTSTVF